MATAQARVFKTANPASFSYTFDRTDTQDGAIDNAGTAANVGAALDAIKALVTALPGAFSSATIIITTFE
jgi:hypothetical protein